MRSISLSALLLVLAFLGIADSWYLAQSALSNTPLSCGLGAVLDGCNIVAKSVYSSFLGLPLALYGVAFFAFVFVLSALTFVFSGQRFHTFLLWLTVAGSLASIAFLSIQFFLIKAMCVYCIMSAILTFMLFFVAYDLWKRKKKNPKEVSVQTTQ